MNKKARGDDFVVLALILVVCLILVLIGYYSIYNPIIKIKEGCWTWEREKVIEHFSLINDYNLSCEQIKDVLLLKMWYTTDQNNFKKENIYIICGDKIIKERIMYCGENCFKAQYKERCLK